MKILLFTLSFFPIFLFAQNEHKKEPWDLDCDYSTKSQLEMSICSYKKYLAADSMLNFKYKTLIQYLEKEYEVEEQYLKSPSDTIQISYLNTLEKQIQSVKKSRQDFNIMLSSTTNIIRYQYEGGTIQPYISNIYALNIIIKQIDIINLISEEIML